MPLRQFQSLLAFNCAGNYAAIVQHWQVNDASGATPFALAKDLRDAFTVPAAGSAFVSTLMQAMSDDSFASSLRVREITSGNLPAAVKLYASTDWPGSYGTDLDAAQVSGVVVSVTAGGNTVNGRNFIPGVPENAYEDGLPAAAWKSQIGNAFDIALAGIQGAINTYLPVIKHGSPASFTQVAHYYLSSTAGTIRRRLVPM